MHGIVSRAQLKSPQLTPSQGGHPQQEESARTQTPENPKGAPGTIEDEVDLSLLPATCPAKPRGVQQLSELRGCQAQSGNAG